MKLSTRAKYGVHAMLDLATNQGMGPQPIKLIAERQGVPEQYLEQLVAALRREGLVRSVRGAQGGYLLAKPPGEITMAELMRVLEGPIALSECLGNEECCEKACVCPTKRVWERLSQSIDEVLSNVSLADMLEDLTRLHAEREEANREQPQQDSILG
jgi:Rrf2 family protein